MDSKLTLKFDETVINKAKAYAAKHNLSLSRLIEHLLLNAVTSSTHSIDDLPIAEWVSNISEPEPEYVKKKPTSKARKKEFYTK